VCFFFFQAEDGIRDRNVTGVQTCALPIYDFGVFESASEEERAGAAAFLAYLLEGENTAKWAIGTGYLPITQAGLDSDLWQDYLRSEERRVGKESRSRMGRCE